MEKGTTKNFIIICTGSDCKKNGSKKLAKSLSKEVKQNKSKILLIKSKCMGYCKKGPNIIINNQLYHYANEESLHEIISTGITSGHEH